METIKLKFMGFWGGADLKSFRLYKTLSKYYQVEISDDPDYIICSCYDRKMSFTKYPQIRIMLSGENFVPDFNLVDYALSTYPVAFQDRNLYVPQCLSGYDGERAQRLTAPRHFTKEDLQKKTRFANFIASHESEYGIRGRFMQRLSEYKRVDCPGSYLNNMPDVRVNWKDNSKTDFQRTCKFTLCFESHSNRGFITEKITDAFYAETIPVYYGDPDAGKIFNSKAFINCSDYETFQDVIDRIIELDKDDEAYLRMMNEPVFNDPDYLQKSFDAYEAFVKHIFEQPYEKAYRRSRVAYPKRYNDYLTAAAKWTRLYDGIAYPWKRLSDHFHRGQRRDFITDETTLKGRNVSDETREHF